MDSKLAWIPAANAISHDVYFGTDEDAVKNATRITSYNVCYTKLLRIIYAFRQVADLAGELRRLDPSAIKVSLDADQRRRQQR